MTQWAEVPFRPLADIRDRKVETLIWGIRCAAIRRRDQCVWILSRDGQDAQTINLGPREAVAEKFVSWLGEQDYGERPADLGRAPAGH